MKNDRLTNQLHLFELKKAWEEEWQGMPEYISENREALVTVAVSFETTEDMKAFSDLIGCPVTLKTKGIFFPPTPPHNLEYVDES